MSNPADDFILVLEQTLGNAVHGRNLERVMNASSGARSRVVRLDYDERSWRRHKPIVGNWTLESSIRARREVQRLLRQRPAAALYVHTPVPALLLGDIMRRVPTVLSTDATPRSMDTFASSYAHTVRAEPVERAKQQVMRCVYGNAAAVVAQSAWTATSLVEDYGVATDKIHVIRPGADLLALRPDTGSRDPRDRLRLLFVGGDFTRKGGPVLLEAVRRLEGRVELDVVTSHDVPDLPDHVRVHKGLDHGTPQLFDLFRAADVFVLPTSGDITPLVIQEALAAGLPIVSTPLAAIPEMTVDGVTGLIVPPGSVDGLVLALRTLLDDAGLRTSMGQAARALAEEHFDAERNNNRVLGLLRAVASPAPTGHGS